MSKKEIVLKPCPHHANGNKPQIGKAFSGWVKRQGVFEASVKAGCGCTGLMARSATPSEAKRSAATFWNAWAGQ